MSIITRYATASTFTNVAAPTTNYGAGALISYTTSADYRRTFITFDLSGLSSANLKSVTLGLYTTTAAAGVPRINRISTSWSETAVTWNAQPGVTGNPLSTSLVGTPVGWHEVSLNVAEFSNLFTTNYGICIQNYNSSGGFWAGYGRTGTYPPYIKLGYAPSAFNKSSPTNGATAVAMNSSNQVTLDWASSTGATSYQYKISTTSGGGTYTSTGTTSSVVVTLAHNTKYYWNVKAINAEGETISNSGTQWTFTTEMETPAAFNKSSPANGATGQSLKPTLSWGASTHATTYYYRYSTTSGGGSWISNGASTSVVLPTLTAGKKYYWHVYATNNSGDITYANSNTQWSFTTLPVPGAFNKISPTNGATAAAMNSSNQVSLTWGTSSNATSYQYKISTTSGGGTWTTATSGVLVAVNHNTLYYWNVRALNASGTTISNSGTQWTFTTEMETPAAFNKSSPTNGATLQPKNNLTLTWGASTYATTYYYRYSTTSGGGSWISNGASTSVTLNNLTPKAKYYWHVYATNNSGDITYANSNTQWGFTVIADPPAAFSKIAPLNGATKQLLKPTLIWEATTDTTSYEYRYGLSSQSGTWVNNSTSTSITLPDFLLYNKLYYWQVRATGEGGTTYADGVITSEWDFTTIVPPIHNVVII